MKVIIPLAGKGTRLRPHTHVTPKPMLKVAGKPVMSYVLDDVKGLPDVEQIVYITGHLRDKVEKFARSSTDIPSVFVEQLVQESDEGAATIAIVEVLALSRPSQFAPFLGWVVYCQRPTGTVFSVQVSTVIAPLQLARIVWTAPASR